MRDCRFDSKSPIPRATKQLTPNRQGNKIQVRWKVHRCCTAVINSKQQTTIPGVQRYWEPATRGPVQRGLSAYDCPSKLTAIYSIRRAILGRRIPVTEPDENNPSKDVLPRRLCRGRNLTFATRYHHPGAEVFHVRAHWNHPTHPAHPRAPPAQIRRELQLLPPMLAEELGLFRKNDLTLIYFFYINILWQIDVDLSRDNWRGGAGNRVL